MRIVDSQGMVVSLSGVIGDGGEAEVWSIDGQSDLVAKIYRKPSSERKAKLQAMVAAPPMDPTAAQGHRSLCWPTSLLFDHQGTCVGFLMPRVDLSSHLPILHLYNPQDRQKSAPSFNWQYLLRTAANVASVVASLHSRGYAVGDLNESNIFVSEGALVSLVDCDSIQVPKGSGQCFRCHVGKPEFTAPELQGRDFASVDRTPEHDNFALAILTFQLLMEGTHPFSGIWNGAEEPPPIEERIRIGGSPHFGNGLARPMPGAPSLSLLPNNLQVLFRKCFKDGQRSPEARPTAGQWHSELLTTEASLRICAARQQHLYGVHLTSCPWCERAKLLGGFDSFSASPQSTLKASAPQPPVTPPLSSKPQTSFLTNLPAAVPPMVPSAPAGPILAATPLSQQSIINPVAPKRKPYAVVLMFAFLSGGVGTLFYWKQKVDALRFQSDSEQARRLENSVKLSTADRPSAPCSVRIAGTIFDDRQIETTRTTSPGDPLEIIGGPSFPADRALVRVRFGNNTIGFVNVHDLSCGSDYVSSIAIGEFISDASLNIARTGHSTDAMETHRYLLATGGETANGITSEAEEYAGSWVLSSHKMSEPRADHSTVKVAGGTKLLIVGGRGPSSAALSSTELFDPSSHTFTRVGPMQIGRRKPWIVKSWSKDGVADDDVLVVGGTMPGASPLLVERFVIETQTWATFSTIPEDDPAMEIDSAITLYRPSQYSFAVFGHIGSAGKMWIFNRVTDAWESHSNVGAAPGAHIEFDIQGFHIVAIGRGTEHSRSVLVKRTIDDKFSVTTPLLTPRRSATFVRGNENTSDVFVVGGCDLSGRPINKTEKGQLGFWSFEKERLWLNAGDLTIPRCGGHTATSMPQSEFLVCGGRGANGSYLSSCERWRPILR